MLFGTTMRRSVHNHALASTADLARSTWFLTGGWYAGTLPPLSSPPGIEWIFSTITINSVQTSCFLVLNFIISIIGGGSDFLSSQILTSSEQISSFFKFFRMRSSGSRHVYDFVSSKSGITLLLLKWRSSFNYVRITKSLICLELAMITVKETKLWSWLNFFSR